MSSKTASKKSAVKTSTTTEKKSAPKDVTQLKKDIRLIPREEFDWSRLVYSEPKKTEIPDGSGNYRRVYLNYMYDDNTIGPVIVEFGRKYCFGVQPDNVDKDGKVIKDEHGKDKSLKGYQVPIVMANVSKENPTPSETEQAEIDFLDEFRNEVIRYSVENKKAIGKGGKTDVQIEALVSELLYRKKNDEGEVVSDVSPKLYGKLIYFTKSKEVGTKFYGPGDKPVNPLSLKGHFFMYPTIRFDSLYISSKISLQHRIYDATVEPTERAPTKRLARPNTMEPPAETPSAAPDNEEEHVDDGDVNDMMESEDEE